MSEIQGGCRCGAVRYTLALEALPRTYACHCRDCQTWTGSAFSQQTFVPEASLSVTGPLAVYELITPSGNVSLQRMCALCHARIFNSNSARPGLVVVRAGTLDRSDELDVVAHIWVKRKQPWLNLPADVPAWSEAAPAAELMQALDAGPRQMSLVQPTITEGYVPGCIGRIAELHALYYASHSGFGVEFEAKVARELAAFCGSYVPGRDGLWLAHADGIEGSIAIDGSRAAEEGAHLRWFITSDRLRGLGMGKQLLSRAVAFSESKGYRRIHLWTFAGLGAARHLYESQRFRLHHEAPGSQWGRQVQEQQFVRGEA